MMEIDVEIYVVISEYKWESGSTVLYVGGDLGEASIAADRASDYYVRIELWQYGKRIRTLEKKWA